MNKAQKLSEIKLARREDDDWLVADITNEKQRGFSALFQILAYATSVRFQFILAVGLLLFSSMLVMLSARMLGKFVELVLAESSDNLWYLVAGIISLEGASILCQFLGRVRLAFVTNQITYQVRCKLFEKMETLPIKYFDGHPIGRTITRLTNDVEGMDEFFSGTLARLIIAFMNITVVLIAMVLTSFDFGIIVVLAATPAIFFTILSRGPVREWLRKYKRRSANVNAKLAENLNGMHVIRIFGLEVWSLEKFNAACKSLWQASMMLLHWNSFIRPVAVFLCAIPLMVIIFYGGNLVLSGSLSVGIVVAFIRYSERFSQPIRTISQEIHLVQEALTSSERVTQMLQEPEENEVFGQDGTVDHHIRGSLTFSDVWMGYDKNRNILKGISFRVEQGMTVGFVGHTGSGKSTCLSLIPRFYDFQRGQILIDGISIKNIRRTFLREQLGMVTQDVVVFRGSLRTNLCGALPPSKTLTDRQILDACERTGLSEFLKSRKQGLDHVILDGGENMSAGEKQLLALTRVLLKNPKILILDEATANIDEKQEMLVQNAVKELVRDRTCLIIAHRLSTILASDLILVFNQGIIVEQGNHDQLIKRDGVYAGLVKEQFKSNASVIRS